MMPAKSTSDQRTYSSTTYGAGMPRQARRLLRGAKVAHAVGAQSPPQRGATDAQPAGGFGQLAACRLQGVENRLALAIGERAAAVRRGARGQDQRLAELHRSVPQAGGTAAEGDELLARVIGPAGQLLDPFHGTAGRLIDVHQTSERIEHDDAV